MAVGAGAKVLLRFALSTKSGLMLLKSGLQLLGIITSVRVFSARGLTELLLPTNCKLLGNGKGDSITSSGARCPPLGLKACDALVLMLTDGGTTLSKRWLFEFTFTPFLSWEHSQARRSQTIPLVPSSTRCGSFRMQPFGHLVLMGR